MKKALFVALAALTLVLTGCSTHQTLIKESRQYVYKMLSPEGRGGGTGFILALDSGQRVIITNRHVCDLAQDGWLVAEREGQRHMVTVIKSSGEHDLCMVTSPVADGGFRLSQYDVERDEEMYVGGYPLLGPLQVTSGFMLGQSYITLAYEQGMGRGECSRPEYTYVEVAFFWFCIQSLPGYQTNAYAAPGSSGSPVFDRYGDVVGVIFAGSDRTNITYFVPLAYLQKFVEIY